VELNGIILFFFGFFSGSAIIWHFRKKEVDLITKNQVKLEQVFDDLSDKALLKNQKNFLELAEHKFSSLIGKSDKQLFQKKELIDNVLREMKIDLKNLSDNTIALKSQIEESRKSLGDLSDTTFQLRQILSSSQSRGQWGERMVEDILNFIGLSEGLNYKKQIQFGSDRPDFTFYLPDKKILNMDVKFPLAHYEKYINSNLEIEKKEEKKAFLKDVRDRIKEVSKRSYINPDKGTVDYVLLFIPNESIYSFLNQEDSSLIDYSLKNKILLCSPINLYAILSLIRQSVASFAMEQRAGEMQELISVFKTQWIKFISKLNLMEKSINALNNHFDDLKGPRIRSLEKPMDKINSLELGSNIERIAK
tara:strand:+ start:7066 stop:8154 length:1089 start_codon:yes stop_codon:yes gene_type:complete